LPEKGNSNCRVELEIGGHCSYQRTNSEGITTTEVQKMLANEVIVREQKVILEHSGCSEYMTTIEKQKYMEKELTFEEQKCLKMRRLFNSRNA